MKRLAPFPTDAELEFGIPIFLQQLIETLRLEQTSVGETAASQDSELRTHGFTVDQVVHAYGDLCQAVTEYGRMREGATAVRSSAATNEQLGFLAHELRNMIGAAMLAVAANKGTLSTRNMPENGCVFVIDLPRSFD